MPQASTPTRQKSDNRMFKQLSNFSLVRSGKQAFGFYLVWLVVLVVLDGLLDGLLEGIFQITTNTTFTFGTGVTIGTVLVIIETLIISFLVLASHKTTKRPGYVVLALVSGVVAFLWGGLGGLIIPAYLTTRD